MLHQIFTLAFCSSIGGGGLGFGLYEYPLSLGPIAKEKSTDHPTKILRMKNSNLKDGILSGYGCSFAKGRFPKKLFYTISLILKKFVKNQFLFRNNYNIYL